MKGQRLVPQKIARAAETENNEERAKVGKSNDTIEADKDKRDTAPGEMPETGEAHGKRKSQEPDAEGQNKRQKL